MSKFFLRMALQSQEISPIMAVTYIFGSRAEVDVGPPVSNINDLPSELDAYSVTKHIYTEPPTNNTSPIVT